MVSIPGCWTMVTFSWAGLAHPRMLAGTDLFVFEKVILKVTFPLASVLTIRTAGGVWQGRNVYVKLMLLEFTLQVTVWQLGRVELVQVTVSPMAWVVAAAR